MRPTTLKEPMLAGTFKEGHELSFPLLATPKIDGFRCLIIQDEEGTVSAATRSFKRIPNKFTRNWLEDNLPAGLDGELVTLDEEGNIEDFNVISSKLRNAEGEPDFRYLVFDVFSIDLSTPYAERMNILRDMRLPLSRVRKLLPLEVEDMESLNWNCKHWLEAGYEGGMIRNPYGRYKQGRSTLKEELLLKIKPFTDEEAYVVGVTEGMHNANKAKLDAFGRVKRSTFSEGMVPSGIVGALTLRRINLGKPSSKEFAEVKVGVGKASFKNDPRYFGASYSTIAATEGDVRMEDADKLLGKVVTFRHWSPPNSKHKPRFPQLVGWRDIELEGIK